MVKEEKFKFSKGMLVEVSSDEEGFEGAWFVATIAELLEDGKFTVEYKTLRNEDDTEFCNFLLYVGNTKTPSESLI